MRRLGAVVLSVLVLTAAGCAEQSGSTSGGGEGVAVGASKEEFRDALADMEPVELVLQSTAPKGAATGRRFEAYAEAVEDWSGGRITFDTVYSNAIAPPAEVDEALADGRLDVGSILPMLDPSTFPANNVLWDMSWIGRQTPVDGLLSWHGAVLEAAASSDELYDEYADLGIEILLPAYHSGSFGYACSEQRAGLDDLRGGVVASQSRTQGEEAEALGLSPASVTYAEMFESLERGVVDCAVTTLTVAVLGGFIPAAPHLVIDPEVGFAAAGGAIGFSQERWESLPLAAQQLLYDRLDVLLEVNFEGTWDNTRDGLLALKEEGTSVEPLADDTRAALERANESVAEASRATGALSDGSGFVDTLLSAEDAWAERVAGLGIDGVDVGYDDFLDWYEPGQVDLDAYFDELWETSMAERRPS